MEVQDRRPLIPAETSRLLLVPWTDAYLDDYIRILSDPLVVQYMSGGRPISPEVAERLSAESERLWQDHGFGPWAVLDKASGLWVGRIGLDLLDDWPGDDRWEVGWELDPDWWGFGLATEGGREALRVGFEIANLKRIIQCDGAREPCLAAGNGQVRIDISRDDGLAGLAGRLVRGRPPEQFVALAPSGHLAPPLTEGSSA